jgi:hypothetical protein
MSTTRLTLSNFKAFGPVAQTVPLKPITLVFGPNSAGKSSIIHSLLWFQHGITQGELDVHTTQRTRTDLGGFNQIVHGHQLGTRPVLGWSIAGAGIKDGVGGWNKFEGFDLELAFQRISGKVEMIGFSVSSAAGPLLRAGRKDELSWRINLLNLEHPAMVRLLDACGSTGLGDFKTLETDLIGDLYDIEVQDFVPVQLVPPNDNDGWLIKTAIPEAFRLLFDAFRRELLPYLRRMTHIPPLRELPARGFDPSRSDDHWHALAVDPVVLNRVNNWLDSEAMRHSRYRLDLVRFIRRDAVERSLSEIVRDAFVQLVATNSFGDDVRYYLEEIDERWKQADRGAYLRRCPEYLEHLTEREIDAFNSDGQDFWLEMNEQEQRDYAEQTAVDIESSEPYYYYDGKATEPHFFEFLKESPELMEFLSGCWDQDRNDHALRRALTVPDTEQRVELLLRDLRNGTMVALQDVGTGISQILPILTAAYAAKDGLTAIEQPELHIHPRLQAELGDLFIESALGGNKNTFLIETHSEHLILRILRRIRETTARDFSAWSKELKKACPDGIRIEDVAVLYVQPGEDGSEVTELLVTKDGGFSKPWPDGFFEEQLKELS